MFTKFQKVEDEKVLSQRESKALENALHKLGKTSARYLSESERKSVIKEVDKTK